MTFSSLFFPTSSPAEAGSLSSLTNSPPASTSCRNNRTTFCVKLFFFKDTTQWGNGRRMEGKKKRREVRRRVVKIAVGCHPGPGLCGNEGLEAALLLPDAVRLLHIALMNGPSHQDFSIKLPSTRTLPHTHKHTPSVQTLKTT